MQNVVTMSKAASLRLLVLGGSGRLGGLLRRAWQVGGGGDVAGAGLVPVWQARQPRAFAGLGGPTVVFDPLHDPGALRAAVRAADVVLMLAGPTRGSAQDLAVHADLARAVLHAADGRAVIFASSAAVYGAPVAGPCREEDAPAPLTDYGRAKLAMERVAAGVPGASVLRIGNVAGADALLGAPPSPGGRVLDILPAGHAPRRSYITPQALALALGRLARLAAAGGRLPGLLNLALPGAVGMDALLRAAGESWRTRPASPGVIDTVVLDVTRAQALGLVPEWPADARQIVAELRGLEGAA